MDINSRTIYVDYLPLDTNELMIRKLFTNLGKIKRLDLPLFAREHPLNKGCPKLRCKGYAFIEFSTSNEANEAVGFFNDINLISTSSFQNSTRTNDDVDDDSNNQRSKIMNNLEFKQLLSARVMSKNKFLELSRQYEIKRFQSFTNIAKFFMA